MFIKSNSNNNSRLKLTVLKQAISIFALVLMTLSDVKRIARINSFNNTFAINHQK